MNQSINKLYSLKEVPLLYKRLFGADLDFHDMLGIVDFILVQTGSRATKTLLFKTSIVDYEIELPCPAYRIRHVCQSKPNSYYSGYFLNEADVLWNYRVDPSGNEGAFNPDATTINEIEDTPASLYEVNKNIFTAPLGMMIDFQNNDNCCLTFNHQTMDIDVLYDVTEVDADGYPKVPEKTLAAIAYYMNYIHVRIKYNKHQADINMLNLAKKEMEQKVANARTPEGPLSQNEEDNILNVMTSSNRKRHNLQHRL